jgi:hypothetical protein
MLAQDLATVFSEECLHNNINVFNAPLPTEWLEQALSLSDNVSIRRRKLPPQQVLRLVVGMSLLRQESIQEVATRLAFSSKGLNNDLLAARSSLSNARQRLGFQPVKALFELSAQHWNKQTHVEDNWQGLQVLSIDGTTLRTEDTPELREHFGSVLNQSDAKSGYPVMQLTCLMNVRNHLILDAQASKFNEPELSHAAKLVSKVSDNSILLMDKLYHSAKLLIDIENNGQKRFWVTPIKKNLKYTVKQKYASNDAYVERDLSSARRKDKSLPRHWGMRLITFNIGRDKEVKLATNLPHEDYSAKDIIELYKERWEIELGYREVKVSMLQNALVLRSKKKDLVYQELYGMLIAYNLVRHEIALTAVEVGIRPTRISFTAALRIVLYDYYMLATTNSLHTIPARMKDLTNVLKDFVLPREKRRSNPREKKTNVMRRYATKKSKHLQTNA